MTRAERYPLKLLSLNLARASLPVFGPQARQSSVYTLIQERGHVVAGRVNGVRLVNMYLPDVSV